MGSQILTAGQIRTELETMKAETLTRGCKKEPVFNNSV